jgi:hypothetical protein
MRSTVTFKFSGTLAVTQLSGYIELKSIARYYLIILLQTAALALEAPIAGYGVAGFSWDIETTPCGSWMTFNGTAQEVAAQLSEVNPNWEQDFNFTSTSKNASKLNKRVPGAWNFRQIAKGDGKNVTSAVLKKEYSTWKAFREIQSRARSW